MTFLEYFNEKVSDVGLYSNEVHLVIVAAPDVYAMLNDEINYTINLQKHFKRGMFSRFKNRLRQYVTLCKQ